MMKCEYECHGSKLSVCVFVVDSEILDGECLSWEKNLKRNLCNVLVVSEIIWTVRGESFRARMFDLRNKVIEVSLCLL